MGLIKLISLILISISKCCISRRVCRCRVSWRQLTDKTCTDTYAAPSPLTTKIHARLFLCSNNKSSRDSFCYRAWPWSHLPPKMSSLIEANHELISRVVLYRAKSPLLYGYTSPFFLLYSIWLYLWIVVYGYENYLEVGGIVGAVLVLVNVLMVLCCHWSVHIMAVMTCTKLSEKNISEATWAKVGLVLIILLIVCIVRFIHCSNIVKHFLYKHVRKISF